MKPENALTFPISMNVSQTSLEEAARLVGPTFIYTLTVHPYELMYTRNMLRTLAAQTEGNPFSPYVNLCVDASFEKHEWTLKGDDKVFWSPGC
jgi:hypothetical protein